MKNTIYSIIFLMITFGQRSFPKSSTSDNIKTPSNSKDSTQFHSSSTTNNVKQLDSTPAISNAATKSTNILDFDADIIEGERSGPSLIVQMDLQAPSLDTLVFQRKNFNDFHVIDRRRKPKFRGQ